MSEDEYAVQPACAVDSSVVERFYAEMYSRRTYPIGSIWKWLNRTDRTNGRFPLLVTRGNRAVAHAGLIPFRCRWQGGEYEAAWFIDFGVLPEFQRKGLGNRLTREWMEYPDVCLALGCNDASMGAFLRCGWHEFSVPRLHHYLIRPFSNPKAVARLPVPLRRMGNLVAAPFVRLNYLRNAAPESHLSIEALTEETLSRFAAAAVIPSGTFHAVRDREFLQWRILSSPDRVEYHLASVDGEPGLLFKLRPVESELRRLDILWAAEPLNLDRLKPLLARLILWAAEQKVAYVRYYCSDETVSDRLARSVPGVVRTARLAYFARDPKLMESLDNAVWHWELLDNDFEFMQ